MREFESKFFEKVVEDPNPSLTRTDVMVFMAEQGMLRPFDPNEDVSRVSQSDTSRAVRTNRPIEEDICKSNVHPSLSAADVPSRSYRKSGGNTGRR